MGTNSLSTVTPFPVRSFRPLDFTHPSRLFEALDGQEVVAQGDTWRVEVYSVCDVADTRWIQFSVSGPSWQMGSVQLTAGQGLGAALRAISSWLDDPAHTTSGITAIFHSLPLQLTAH
jgi:hypothetical protein